MGKNTKDVIEEAGISMDKLLELDHTIQVGIQYLANQILVLKRQNRQTDIPSTLDLIDREKKN